jgi:hypothetical protein
LKAFLPTSAVGAAVTKLARHAAEIIASVKRMIIKIVLKGLLKMMIFFSKFRFDGFSFISF